MTGAVRAAQIRWRQRAALLHAARARDGAGANAALGFVKRLSERDAPIGDRQPRRGSESVLAAQSSLRRLRPSMVAATAVGRMQPRARAAAALPKAI